jgi:hypothetical protein
MFHNEIIPCINLSSFATRTCDLYHQPCNVVNSYHDGKLDWHLEKLEDEKISFNPSDIPTYSASLLERVTPFRPFDLMELSTSLDDESGFTGAIIDILGPATFAVDHQAPIFISQVWL